MSSCPVVTTVVGSPNRAEAFYAGQYHGRHGGWYIGVKTAILSHMRADGRAANDKRVLVWQEACTHARLHTRAAADAQVLMSVSAFDF